MARPSGSDPLAPLREGEPGPLYFLHGKERYLLDRAVVGHRWNRGAMPVSVAIAVLDDVMDFLRGGLDALRRQ